MSASRPNSGLAPTPLADVLTALGRRPPVAERPDALQQSAKRSSKPIVARVRAGAAAVADEEPPTNGPADVGLRPAGK